MYFVARRIFLMLVLCLIGSASLVKAQSDPNDSNEPAAGGLFGLPLEELMDIEVISATRTRGQNVLTSPAAIYVITQEEIRRSGHRTIPELLRMVPGLYVAQIDGGKWVVSSRGFPERFYRMMLVQIDGRTLYSPIFSGVFWESVDYVLDDIERIEVIRGPGGSLWGANAFNGIINIITKSSKDTQGGYFLGGGGDEYRGFGTVRYGGKLSEDSFYRVYAKGLDTDCSRTFGNPGFTDDLGTFQTGFRTDWGLDNGDSVTFQGDFHSDRNGSSFRVADIANGTNPLVNADLNTDSWNMLGRWNRDISDESRMYLQMYFDRNKREVDESQANFREQYEIFDIDFEHFTDINKSDDLVWGLGFRRVYTDVDGIDKLSFNPDSRVLHTFSGFVQASWAIGPQSKFTLGTKLEKNDISDFEIQPRASYVFTPNERESYWAAISRAVRVPSLTNRNETIVKDVLSPGNASKILPNSDFDSEEVIAYEVGYRVLPSESVSLDLTAFLNDYTRLEALRPVDLQSVRWDNDQTGRSYGTELLLNWRPLENLKLVSGYTFLKMDLNGGDDKGVNGRSPENQFQVRSYYNITDNLELNAAVYYYDNNPTEDIPAFARTDIGMAWKVNEDLEMGVWGQNIFDSDHQEFGPDRFFSTGGGYIERGFYGYLKHRF